jgi:hypothetical protein
MAQWFGWVRSNRRWQKKIVGRGQPEAAVGQGHRPGAGPNEGDKAMIKRTLHDVLAGLAPGDRRLVRRRLRQLADFAGECLDLAGQAINAAELARAKLRLAEVRLRATKTHCRRCHVNKRGLSARREQDLAILKLHDEQGVRIKDLARRFGRRKASSLAQQLWRVRRRLRDA